MPGEEGRSHAMLTRGSRPRPFSLRRLAASLCLALSLACTGMATARADVWQELVAADKAVAAKAANGDLRGAFLEALSEDAIALSPGPVSARAVWTARAAGNERMEWAPSQAEVSISGDLGYTIDAWRYTAARAQVAQAEVKQGDNDDTAAKADASTAEEAPAEDTPDAYGHLLNIWQRKPGGEWKLLLNHAIRHGAVSLPAQAIRRGSLFAGTAPGWPVGVQELRKADLEPAGGVRPELVSADFIRLRDGLLPDGNTSSDAFDLRWSRRMESGMVIAGAGDLAVTWGGGPASVRWLRVWRRPVSGDPPGLGWRLAVDLSQAAIKPVE